MKCRPQSSRLGFRHGAKITTSERNYWYDTSIQSNYRHWAGTYGEEYGGSQHTCRVVAPVKNNIMQIVLLVVFLLIVAVLSCYKSPKSITVFERYHNWSSYFSRIHFTIILSHTTRFSKWPSKSFMQFNYINYTIYTNMIGTRPDMEIIAWIPGGQ
jgi:hypothetical protein